MYMRGVDRRSGRNYRDATVLKCMAIAPSDVWAFMSLCPSFGHVLVAALQLFHSHPVCGMQCGTNP